MHLCFFCECESHSSIVRDYSVGFSPRIMTCQQNAMVEIRQTEEYLPNKLSAAVALATSI